MSKIIRNLLVFVASLIFVFLFVSCMPEVQVEKPAEELETKIGSGAGIPGTNPVSANERGSFSTSTGKAALSDGDYITIFGADFGYLHYLNWKYPIIVKQTTTNFNISSLEIDHEVIGAGLRSTMRMYAGHTYDVRFKWYDPNGEKVFDWGMTTEDAGDHGYSYWYAYDFIAWIGFCDDEILINGQYHVDITLKETGSSSNTFSTTKYFNVSGAFDGPDSNSIGARYENNKWYYYTNFPSGVYNSANKHVEDSEGYWTYETQAVVYRYHNGLDNRMGTHNDHYYNCTYDNGSTYKYYNSSTLPDIKVNDLIIHGAGSDPDENYLLRKVTSVVKESSTVLKVVTKSTTPESEKGAFVLELNKSLTFSKNLSGYEIYDYSKGDDKYGAGFKVTLDEGSSVSFTPNVHFKAVVSDYDLQSIEGWGEGTINANAIFKVEVNGQGNYQYEKCLKKSVVRKVYATMVGWLPVWVEIVVDLYAGVNVSADAAGWVSAGFSASGNVKAGAKWNGSWSNELSYSVTGNKIEPKWGYTGSITVEPYIEPRVKVYVYSIAGANFAFHPYIEATGTYTGGNEDPDGAASVDIKAGIKGNVTFELRGWDEPTASYGPIDIFDYVFYENHWTPNNIDWDLKYEANNLPYNQGWGVNGSSYHNLEDGKLVIEAIPDGSSTSYFYHNWRANHSVGQTVEARLKINPDYNGWTSLTVGNDDNVVHLTLYPGGFRLNPGSSYSLDTSVFHTYRITLKNANYKLYVDGELFATTTAYTNVTWWNMLLCGDRNDGPDGNGTGSEWDYVYYTKQGVFAP